MRLKWHGTAALTIESDGFTIAVDPFIGMPLRVSDEQRRSSGRADELRAADAVLVTHGHIDHIYDIAALYGDSEVVIYAPETAVKTLRREGIGADRLRAVSDRERLSIGPFSVSAYHARHCRFDIGVVMKTVFNAETWRNMGQLLRLGRINRRFPENGETYMYEIACRDRRVDLMGSMGLRDDGDYPVGADTLILPFQGTGDPAKTCRPIVDRLKPKRILLDHYDNSFPPLSSQIHTAAFEREMTDRGIPCEALTTNRVYEI